MNNDDLKHLLKLLPNASPSFLRLHGFMAPQVRDTKFERPAGEEPLDTDEAQKRGAGRRFVCITRCGVRLLDRDNLWGGVKPACDALRYAGLIRDDDPSAVLLYVRQKKVRKDQTGTQIIITQL